MATVVNTLYPPTVPTFQNAFVNTQDAVVYFTLSSFNSADDIKRVHVTCVNQMTNENALNLVSGVLIEDLMYSTSSGMYYVTIPTSKLENNYFNVNQFYKVQIRFDAYPGNDVPTDEKKKNTYLTSNLEYFSEWSSVCLIRPITEPHMRISVFDNYTGDKRIAFNRTQINISGALYFGNGSSTETETLQSYKIEIMDDGGEVVQYTPTVYTGENVNPNTINYNVDMSNLDADMDKYTMRITALTKNQYRFHNDYEFTIADYNDDTSWRPTITAELDDERGIVSVHVTNQYAFTTAQTLYIRRASSEDKYATWENLYVAKHQNIDVTIEDSTVTSQVWYKYKVELANENGVFYANGSRGISSIVFPQFYDAFLSRGDQQYAIRYNYKISGFKPTVNRTKIDTLGGQYPRFAENAAMNYRQFSITGTMTAESDAYQEFIKKSNVYSGDIANSYSLYKSDSDVEDLIRNDFQDWIIDGENQYPATSMPSSPSQSFLTTTHNDWLWEREFREQLTAWLNDGEPKLYRSMTEGSMVVMITDVSLTPNSTLGRRIWDFSATLYEIADTKIETLDSLGIYETVKLSTITGDGDEDPSDDDYIQVIKPGQTYTYTVADTNDIRNRILADLELKYSGVLSNKKPSYVVLKNVKIFFNNQPNPYYFDDSGNPQLAPTPTPGGAIDSAYQSLVAKNRIQNGYVFEVVTSAGSGQQVIFVNSRGYYQIPEKLDVKSLSFDHIGDVVTIEYTLCYREYKSSSETTSGTSVDRTLVGQEQGVFEAYQYLGDTIKSKYSYVKTSKDVMLSKQQMQYFKGIYVDVTPFAMLSIKYRDASDYQTYEIGATGTLNVLNNFEVDNLCFIGIRMEQITANRARFVGENQYIDMSATVCSKTSDISSPIEHGVYTVADGLQIYFSGRWYKFSIKNSLAIAEIPVEGTVNYYGSVVVTNYS